jgi:hypothetical protein
MNHATQQGLLLKSHVSLVGAQNIVNRLCDSTKDEEKSSRLEVVNNTYLNGVDFQTSGDFNCSK